MISHNIRLMSRSDNGRWFDHVDSIEKANCFSHDLFVSGDYIGSHVQASNRRVLLENTELCKRLGIEELNESYSTDSLIFPIEALNDPELQEIFEALDNYPCLDDEDVSLLESEMETEDFDSFGHREFENYLVEKELLTEDQAENITREQLTEIYSKASCLTSYGIYSVESGTSGYFDFDSFGGLGMRSIEILKNIIKEVLK